MHMVEYMFNMLDSKKAIVRFPFVGLSGISNA
jgi:hypothetical protein